MFLIEEKAAELNRPDGPLFRYAGRFPIYPISGLSKISPLVRSRAEARGAGQFHSEKK